VDPRVTATPRSAGSAATTRAPPSTTKEHDMARKQKWTRGSLVAAVALAATSGVAFADDSSMSMWTGDSYAYFNNLDYGLGKFNVARTSPGSDASTVAKSRRQDAPKPESRVLLATRPSKGTPTSPFSDDKGA
jgi:hypothetical protein